MSHTLDIEVGNNEQYREMVFNKIDRILTRNSSDQDYSFDAIQIAFDEIGHQVPGEVIRAHELLNANPVDGPQRADVLSEMIAISENMAVLYAEWNRTVNQLEFIFFPPKMKNGDKLTEKERDTILDAHIAPYKAVSDIIYYLFVQTAKIAPPIHQSLLNYERELLNKSMSM